MDSITKPQVNCYGAMDSFSSIEAFSQMEERIISFLDTESISITDPLQKQEKYFSNNRRKLDKVRSLRSNCTIESNEEESLNSLKSLPNISFVDSRNSLHIITNDEGFLKSSISWKLKNRRKTTGIENKMMIPSLEDIISNQE